MSSAGNALLGFQIDLMRARAVLAQAITPGAPAPAQSLAWRTLGAASCSPLAALVVADAETEARDGSDSDSDDVDGGAQADSVLLACGYGAGACVRVHAPRTLTTRRCGSHALVAVAARDGAPTAPPLGSEFTSGSRDGAGECARFARPAAVALDGAAGTLWVADTGFVHPARVGGRPTHKRARVHALQHRNSAVRHVTWYARQSSHATPQAVAATSVRDDDRLAHASCIACSTCRDRVCTPACLLVRAARELIRARAADIGGRTSSTLLELDPFSGALAGVATLPAPPVALCALDGGALAALCEQTAPAGAPRAPVVVCVLRPPVRAACRALQQLALTHSCTYAGTSGSGVVVCTSARHSIELWDTRTGMPRVLAGRADEPGYAVRPSVACAALRCAH